MSKDVYYNFENGTLKDVNKSEKYKPNRNLTLPCDEYSPTDLYFVLLIVWAGMRGAGSTEQANVESALHYVCCEDKR